MRDDSCVSSKVSKGVSVTYHSTMPPGYSADRSQFKQMSAGFIRQADASECRSGGNPGSHSREDHGSFRSRGSESSGLRFPVRSKQQTWSSDKMLITNNKTGRVMDVDSSRTITEDYVRYCLEKHGLDWQNGQRDVTPNEIQRAMRAMGDEFETRFSNTFDDMINQLHITPDTAYQTFKTIVNEIFKDGVNWGRVVALFGFAGKLSVRCVQQSMPQLVNSIVDWTSNYVDTNLKSWIAANSGWGGFLAFSQVGPDKRTKDDAWPSLKKLCGYAAAGLGILTLGAFLSQKS